MRNKYVDGNQSRGYRLGFQRKILDHQNRNRMLDCPGSLHRSPIVWKYLARDRTEIETLFRGRRRGVLDLRREREDSFLRERRSRESFAIVSGVSRETGYLVGLKLDLLSFIWRGADMIGMLCGFA
jgi:hypothetical protein